MITRVHVEAQVNGQRVELAHYEFTGDIFDWKRLNVRADPGDNAKELLAYALIHPEHSYVNFDVTVTREEEPRWDSVKKKKRN